MDDDQLERFARQILMPDWGVEGQLALASKRVLLIGCGGLGTWLAHLLMRAGLGHLALFDSDHVDRSNLHRQLYREADVGRSKAEALADQLSEFGVVVASPRAVTPTDLDDFADYDLWIDATDQWDIRLAVSLASQAHQVPWIYGSAIATSGQVAAFDPTRPGPCYHCLFGQLSDPGHSCEASGVLGPVVSTVASCQAQWALTYLAGMAQLPVGRLRRWDGPWLDCIELKTNQRAGCLCAD